MPRARLSAKKYATAIKALNEMIENEKIGVVRRLKALDLLLDLYRRYDAMQERKERAQARKEAGLPPETVAIPAETTQALLDAEARERTRAIFDGLMGREAREEVS